MISISTVEVLSTGSNLTIRDDERSEIVRGEARISRRATLDGETSFSHFGFSHGDRQFTIKARIEEDDADILVGIFTIQTLVYLSCTDGFFSGYIKKLRADHGDLNLTFWVKEKLA